MSQGVLYIIVALIILIGAGVYFGRQWYMKGRKPKAKPVPPANKPLLQHLAGTIKQVAEKLTANQPTVETVSLQGEINALVVDVKKKKFRPMHVDLIPDKDYGREWDYLTHSGVYYLQRNVDKTIVPIIPREILQDSPTELYEAVQTADDMQEVFGWVDEGTNKSRLFLMIVAAVVTVFIMFMAMTYKKQGG